MMPTESLVKFCDFFSATYEKSITAFPFNDLIEAKNYWITDKDLKKHLSEKLLSIITIHTPENSDGYNHLREAYKAYYFDEVIGRNTVGLKATANAMWHHIGWRKVANLDTPEWVEAIALGRALALYPPSHLPADFPHQIHAAKSLLARGYKITALYGQFQFEDGEIEKATKDSESFFNQAGLLQSLELLVTLIKNREKYAYGMFLTSRKTSNLEPASPSHPYAFIYNLILRCNRKTVNSSQDEGNFIKGAELCREIATFLDLEPSHFLEFTHVRPDKIDLSLQRTAHFEHLLSIKQWLPHKVEKITQSFWGITLINSHEQYRNIRELKDQALKIWSSLQAQLVTPRPILVSRNELLKSGLNNTELNLLLPSICHKAGIVNPAYASPFSASSGTLSDLAFTKPLIEYDKNVYLIPFPPAFGPSLLEALLAKCFENKHPLNAEIVGQGAEAVTKDIFSSKKDASISYSKEYKLNSPKEDGECDLIIETAKHILFVECKAKPTTRLTMSGEPHEALLDYAGAVLAAQVQLLTHERILRQRGKIEFTDGTSLQLNNRQIWRLSVTLHDHGGLQDPSFISALTSAIAQVSFSANSDFPKQKTKQVIQLNEMAESIRKEVKELQNLDVDFRWITLTSPSFCVSHLSVIFDDYPTTDSFIESLRVVVSTGTQNPLLEHYYNKKFKAPSV